MQENTRRNGALRRGDAEKEAAARFFAAAATARAERAGCQRQIERVRAECERVTACCSAARRGGGSGRRDALLVLLADLEDTLCSRIEEYWRACAAAEELLEALPDPRWRTVIRLRDLEGLTWPEVREAMNRDYSRVCDRRTILRLHDAALRAAGERLKQAEEERMGE